MRCRSWKLLGVRVKIPAPAGPSPWPLEDPWQAGALDLVEFRSHAEGGEAFRRYPRSGMGADDMPAELDGQVRTPPDLAAVLDEHDKLLGLAAGRLDHFGRVRWELVRVGRACWENSTCSSYSD